MDPLTAGTLGISAGSAIYGTTAGLIQGKQNYAQQRKVLKWQKKMQKRAWKREDNAVQRRAADLQKAGLSKTLAAGNAAQASAPISPSAPQESTSKDVIKNLGAALNAAGIGAQIDKTMAEAELIRAKEDKVEKESVGQGIKNEFDRLANPRRLQHMIIENRGGNIKNRNEKLRFKAIEAGISNTQANTALAIVNKRLAGKKVTKMEKETAAIELAIEAQRHNIDLSKMFSLRTNEMLPEYGKYSQYTDLKEHSKGIKADIKSGVTKGVEKAKEAIEGILDNNTSGSEWWQPHRKSGGATRNLSK